MTKEEMEERISLKQQLADQTAQCNALRAGKYWLHIEDGFINDQRAHVCLLQEKLDEQTARASVAEDLFKRHMNASKDREATQRQLVEQTARAEKAETLDYNHTQRLLVSEQGEIEKSHQIDELQRHNAALRAAKSSCPECPHCFRAALAAPAEPKDG